MLALQRNNLEVGLNPQENNVRAVIQKEPKPRAVKRTGKRQKLAIEEQKKRDDEAKKTALKIENLTKQIAEIKKAKKKKRAESEDDYRDRPRRYRSREHDRYVDDDSDYYRPRRNQRGKGRGRAAEN